MIPLFFGLHPGLGVHFPPLGDRAHDDLFADRHRKVVNEIAGEVLAYMTSFEFPGIGALPNRTGLAIDELIVGLATGTANLFHGQVVDRGQTLLEFLVVLLFWFCLSLL